MEKALGENKAKYTHAGSMLLAPQGRGASGGRSDFNISNQCREEEWQRDGSRYTESPASGSDTISPSFQKTPLSPLHSSLM